MTRGPEDGLPGAWKPPRSHPSLRRSNGGAKVIAIFAPSSPTDPSAIAMGAAGASFLATLVIQARGRHRRRRVYRAVARAAAQATGALTAGEREVLRAIALSLDLDARAVAEVERGEFRAGSDAEGASWR